MDSIKWTLRLCLIPKKIQGKMLGKENREKKYEKK